MSKDTERARFLAALAADEDDNDTRLVFADFLDENDEPEEADRMRRWQKSKEWLTSLAAQFGVTCTNYGAYWNDDGTYGEDTEPEQWRPITFTDLIDAGRNLLDRDDYFTQMGSEAARDMMTNKELVKDFWRHWSVITGVQVPEEKRGDQPFSCSC